MKTEKGDGRKEGMEKSRNGEREGGRENIYLKLVYILCGCK